MEEMAMKASPLDVRTLSLREGGGTVFPLKESSLYILSSSTKERKGGKKKVIESEGKQRERLSCVVYLDITHEKKINYI